jgi:multidrug efflux system outer membrane protein
VSRITRRFAVSLALAGTAACTTVGPNYRQPAVETPATFRGASATADATTVPAIADAEWQTVFGDPVLRDLITTALAQNYDAAIGAARILQAEALLGITHSSQLPSVNANASVQGQRSSIGTSDGEARTAGVIQLGASTSWQPDFWGRYRRATEAARAELLASEWGRRGVITTLISQVATSYYSLQSLDAELAIATSTLSTREDSLRITQVRERGGATSLVDVRQAEQLVYDARITITDLQRQIEQEENFLSTLLGRNPGPITRTPEPPESASPMDVPAGLPAALLERRPDIQRAEQLIVAANADIGVARAAFFPQVALTGSGGLASTALAALFAGPSAAWSAVAAVTQPVFTGGRLRANVALAEARRDEAVLAYRQTVQTAFREVADALSAYQHSRELRQNEALLVDAARDARRLADIRYRGGVAGYLEVLDSDTRLFNAEQQAARARFAEQAAFVEIYRTLGGGWRP